MVAAHCADGIAGSNHGHTARQRDGFPAPTDANRINAKVVVAHRVAALKRDGAGFPAAAVVAAGQRA